MYRKLFACQALSVPPSSNFQKFIAEFSSFFMSQYKPQNITPIAVCSWSLRPADAAALAREVRQCGLGAVQLHLNPIADRSWDHLSAREALASTRIVSGMMAPVGEDYSTMESIRRTGGVRSDDTWEANRQLARRIADVCEVWKIGLVTLHAGFVPAGGGLEHEAMVERVAWLAECFAKRGTRLALETGQEAAGTLIEFLRDLDAATDAVGAGRVGINFDPANMLLYGTGDPVPSLRVLRERVVQVHIKDAARSATPGVWGEETVVGRGGVDWGGVFEVLGRGRMPQLVIEREGGETRVEDVKKAVALVSRLVACGA